MKTLVDFLRAISLNFPKPLVKFMDWPGEPGWWSSAPNMGPVAVEYRLEQNTGEFDIALLVERGLVLQKINAGNLTLPLSGTAIPNWEQFLSFLQEWVEDAGRFPAVYHVWINVDQVLSEEPKLWYYIGLKPLGLPPKLKAIFLKNALRALCEPQPSFEEDALVQGDPSEEGDALVQVMEALPSTAVIAAASVPDHRGIKSVRLVLLHLKWEQLLRLLREFEWKGGLEDLETQLTPLVGLTDHIGVIIDVDEQGIMAHIGLECFFEPENGVAKIHAFIGFLEDRQLCTQANGESLRRFIDSHGFLGEHRSMESEPDGSIRANFSHFKLVFHSGKLQQAKTYLFFV